MEDAATAEIARVQLWQWVKYGSKTVRLGFVALFRDVIPAAYGQLFTFHHFVHDTGLGQDDHLVPPRPDL